LRVRDRKNTSTDRISYSVTEDPENAARHAIVQFLKPVSDDLATHLDALGYSIGEQIIPGSHIVSWTASEPEREYKGRIRKMDQA
jgi:hypothetical protein